MSKTTEGNVTTEEVFEDALTEQKRILREKNPETIILLNEMQAECRKLSNTLLSMYRPEGFIKNVIDALYVAYGYIGMALVFFGAGRSNVKFENTKSAECDVEINGAETLYNDLYGTEVAKQKVIRMFILALAAKMDKLGVIITDYDAQLELGRARTKLNEAIIMIEQSCYSVSFIDSVPKSHLIDMEGRKL
jgi:hypothetical protein